MLWVQQGPVSTSRVPHVVLPQPGLRFPTQINRALRSQWVHHHEHKHQVHSQEHIEQQFRCWVSWIKRRDDVNTRRSERAAAPDFLYGDHLLFVRKARLEPSWVHGICGKPRTAPHHRMDRDCNSGITTPFVTLCAWIELQKRRLAPNMQDVADKVRGVWGRLTGAIATHPAAQPSAPLETAGHRVVPFPSGRGPAPAEDADVLRGGPFQPQAGVAAAAKGPQPRVFPKVAPGAAVNPKVAAKGAARNWFPHVAPAPAAAPAHPPARVVVVPGGKGSKVPTAAGVPLPHEDPAHVNFRLVGAGGYGSVIAPALRCDGSPSAGHVSKVFKNDEDGVHERSMAAVVKTLLPAADQVHFVLPDEWCHVDMLSVKRRLVAGREKLPSASVLRQGVFPFGGATLEGLLAKGEYRHDKAHDLQLLKAIEGVFMAVAALVRAHLIHFDIKPPNIVMPADGTALAKLIDVGMMDSFERFEVTAAVSHDSRVASLDVMHRPAVPPAVTMDRVALEGGMHSGITGAYFFWPFEVTLNAHLHALRGSISNELAARQCSLALSKFQRIWELLNRGTISFFARRQALLDAVNPFVQQVLLGIVPPGAPQGEVLRQLQQEFRIVPSKIDVYSLGCTLLYAGAQTTAMPAPAGRLFKELTEGMVAMAPKNRLEIGVAHEKYSAFLAELGRQSGVGGAGRGIPDGIPPPAPRRLHAPPRPSHVGGAGGGGGAAPQAGFVLDSPDLRLPLEEPKAPKRVVFHDPGALIRHNHQPKVPAVAIPAPARPRAQTTVPAPVPAPIPPAAPAAPAAPAPARARAQATVPAPVPAPAPVPVRPAANPVPPPRATPTFVPPFISPLWNPVREVGIGDGRAPAPAGRLQPRVQPDLAPPLAPPRVQEVRAPRAPPQAAEPRAPPQAVEPRAPAPRAPAPATGPRTPPQVTGPRAPPEAVGPRPPPPAAGQRPFPPRAQQPATGADSGMFNTGPRAPPQPVGRATVPAVPVPPAPQLAPPANPRREVREARRRMRDEDGIAEAAADEFGTAAARRKTIVIDDSPEVEIISAFYVPPPAVQQRVMRIWVENVAGLCSRGNIAVERDMTARAILAKVNSVFPKTRATSFVFRGKEYRAETPGRVFGRVRLDAPRSEFIQDPITIPVVPAPLAPGEDVALPWGAPWRVIHVIARTPVSRVFGDVEVVPNTTVAEFGILVANALFPGSDVQPFCWHNHTTPPTEFCFLDVDLDAYFLEKTGGARVVEVFFYGHREDNTVADDPSQVKPHDGRMIFGGRQRPITKKNISRKHTRRTRPRKNEAQ